jgi:hypothetical protein
MSDTGKLDVKIDGDEAKQHKVEVVYVPKLIEKKEKEHQCEDEDEEKKSEVWKSCCFELNPHGVAYFGQFVFSMSVFGFCAIMLVKSEGRCAESSPYIGIISFLLGKLLNGVVSSSTN